MAKPKFTVTRGEDTLEVEPTLQGLSLGVTHVESHYQDSTTMGMFISPVDAEALADKLKEFAAKVPKAQAVLAQAENILDEEV